MNKEDKTDYLANLIKLLREYNKDKNVYTSEQHAMVLAIQANFILFLQQQDKDYAEIIEEMRKWKEDDFKS